MELYLFNNGEDHRLITPADVDRIEEPNGLASASGKIPLLPEIILQLELVSQAEAAWNADGQHQAVNISIR